MARDRAEPQRTYTENGPPAYHEPLEPLTKRVVLSFGGKATDCGYARLKILHPLFRDQAEEEAFAKAVAAIRPWERFAAPRDFDPEQKRTPGAGSAWLGMQRLCDEIVSLAQGMDAGRPTAADGIARPGMSRGARDRRLAELRAQAAGMGSGWEDYA